MNQKIDKEFILQYKEADFDTSGRISFHVDMLGNNWKPGVFQKTIEVLEQVQKISISQYNVLPEAIIALDGHNFINKESLQNIIFADFSPEEIDKLVKFTPPDIIIETKPSNYKSKGIHPWFLNRKLETLSTQEYEVFHVLMYDKEFDECNSYLRINMANV